MGTIKDSTFLITLILIVTANTAFSQVKILENQIGIRTMTPETELDIRSASNFEKAGLQVGNRSAVSKIQLLSGTREDERSFLFFSPQDTFLFARQHNTDTTEILRFVPGGAMEVLGYFDLKRSKTDFSVYIGTDTGTSNGDGFSLGNVFIGHLSGQNNQTGSRNTFVGRSAGRSNQGGTFNTFIGNLAGSSNTGGIDNTALGTMAGENNTMGSENIFVGNQAGSSNTNGNANIFIGRFSGLGSVTGVLNTHIGNAAGPLNNASTLDGSIAIGNNAKVDCSYCAVIGGTDEYAVKLGLGVPAPTAKLDVGGTVRIRDLPPGTGNLVVVDGNGNLFRQATFAQNDTENSAQLRAENLALRTELDAVKSRLNQLEAMVLELATQKASSSFPERQPPANNTGAVLQQNHPNPFRASTQIRYAIPESTHKATLQITNIRGELIRSIDIQDKGVGQTTLQAGVLPAGTYFYSLVLDGAILETRKMVLTD